MTHKVATRAAAYSHSSIGYAACSCGWMGQDRDLNSNTGPALVILDADDHLRDIDRSAPKMTT